MINNDNFTKVEICQSPKIGRKCGVLETDTLRLLDPPLIMELKIDKDLSDTEMQYVAKSFICKVTLFDLETRSNCDYLVETNSDQDQPPKIIQNFVGKRVTTAKVLRDSENLENPKKLFFVFPQLSVRICGNYYISCVVSKLGGRDRSELELEHCRMNTPPFEVYTAYRFPGNLGKRYS
jgi:Velvet factor